MKTNSTENEKSEDVVCEVRPGGMLVQKRDDDEDFAVASSSGPMITVNVSHSSHNYELVLPAHSTFGDMKKHLAQKSGLEPQEQKLLFRGKEKEDDEHLDIAGIKDTSKVLLLIDPAFEERKVDLEEMNKSNEIPKGWEEVAGVRAEVDKLSERVTALEVAVNGGTKVAEKEFLTSAELLMRQLLKLDSIEAEGEARLQRKAEVRRVQNFVEIVDSLKARNSNPSSSNPNNTISVTTEWETFDSGVGSLNAPPSMPSSVRVNQDWERFD